MQRADLLALTRAAQRLESSNLATHLSQLVGMPIEKAMAALPGHCCTHYQTCAHQSLGWRLEDDTAQKTSTDEKSA